jgi:hypothetical protein
MSCPHLTDDDVKTYYLSLCSKEGKHASINEMRNYIQSILNTHPPHAIHPCLQTKIIKNHINYRLYGIMAIIIFIIIAKIYVFIIIGLYIFLLYFAFYPFTRVNKICEKNIQMIEKKTIDSCIPKYKKHPISSTLKRKVWDTHIGQTIGQHKCFCCNLTYITQLSFHCGHVIPESKGGDTKLSNLRPICQNCNSSMGTQNMYDFMKTFH